MRYFLLVFFISASCLANEVILDRTNKMGIRKIDILKKDKGVYTFDGKILGKSLPPKVAAAWKQVERGPASAGKARCHAGTYIYINKISKKETRKEGCAEGVEYGRFVQHIEDIRTHAQGK
ncbi:hypothetical protein [Bdellovibrio bacteriovorus]|uniref:Uncharacterized protein n=1 Tax=Bdellovibrio bacteriovorus TaxID=959 RepID=A0A1Z3N5T9_BDEBC|nr:hypothetical protein [Bdellovibrio bacteriovorus]ASD62826.1 hypothetical protein B9G79_04210 [Bdellovibrio bacteriovorus]